MTMLEYTPSLTDQVYDTIVDEICGGRLEPGTHLVQARLAERYGISRQPVQQAMARLKADGMVEELGRRGLFVAPLDPLRMRDHYGIRAALDSWAARAVAERVRHDLDFSARLEQEGRKSLAAGIAAVEEGDVAKQVRCDNAFHFMIYSASGNAMMATTAEPHWRFLRRAMGAVLRKVESPNEIWRQHRAILDAILAGDGAAAEKLASEHALRAAERLSRVLVECEEGDQAL